MAVHHVSTRILTTANRVNLKQTGAVAESAPLRSGIPPSPEEGHPWVTAGRQLGNICSPGVSYWSGYGGEGSWHRDLLNERPHSSSLHSYSPASALPNASA
ncbi:hypothetical protein JZ751_024561 [Albula glossodonta]|uniref:Uncharacterized protein n=1 Tax=Albula glossodonta TaxID=121402 RepID=A0A8T2PLE2_9TELE|nr:hypothetical protein JZ751_024561 [Albula glossodonta]